jgi:hypothetical protein
VLYSLVPCRHHCIARRHSDDRLLSYELLTARRLALVSRLRTVYPICELESGLIFSIRGVKLPSPRMVQGYEEEEVSTALGFTCHMVMLLAKYLEVQ